MRTRSAVRRGGFPAREARFFWGAVAAGSRFRRLVLEPLEERTLLDGLGALSGTVFEDLDRDGVHDVPDEPGLEGWTVELEQIGGTGQLLESFANPDSPSGSEFGRAVAFLGDDVVVAAPGGVSGTVFRFDGTSGDRVQTFPSP
ncbi:MAG: hypothetical protein ACYSWU_13165, partial [Planctomycetota bacterium]